MASKEKPGWKKHNPGHGASDRVRSVGEGTESSGHRAVPTPSSDEYQHLRRSLKGTGLDEDGNAQELDF